MSETHHIATLLPPMWGHTVGYLHLVLQLLNADPTLVMSIVQHELMVGQMEKELAACTYDTARLRIIGVGDKDVAFDPNAFEVPFTQLLMGWMQTLPGLAQGSPGWPKPKTIHFDFTTARLFSGIALMAPRSSSSVNDYDFAAIFEKIYNDETLRAGRTKGGDSTSGIPSARLATAGINSLGKVVKILGVPDMYDYERLSHAAGPPVWHWPILTSGQTLAKGVDGYIAASGAYIEPGGHPTHEKYFEEHPAQEPITNQVVSKFLDVRYSSPLANRKHVEALVETLLAQDPPFPFVFALGSSFGQTALPQSLIDRVNASGNGLICTYWVEQRAILQHDAVGWFLTHGGFNSITESLTLGMPMIIWPAGAEQPGNAAYFSSGPHPVAMELLQQFEIRTGPQIGPSLRFGDSVKITGTVEDAVKEYQTVLADARGKKGKILRANAGNAAKMLRAGRKGEAAEEIKRLAAF
ncbi:hypothetical protein C8F01DRAFT_1250143 [Mycena amicta]|nr:hypothetical protein C8F01DRAFT_1250143 [Mycena amicta]